MRVVLVDAPESLLEQRRRQGMDKFDEMWEGEWHFANPPKSWHQRLNFDLGLVLGPRARQLGLEPFWRQYGSSQLWRRTGASPIRSTCGRGR